MREVAEELGVICVETDLRFLGCVPMEQVFGRLQLLRGFILRCDSEATTFALGKAEVTAAGWFCMKELERRMKKSDPAMVPMTATFQHVTSENSEASNAVEGEAALPSSVDRKLWNHTEYSHGANIIYISSLAHVPSFDRSNSRGARSGVILRRRCGDIPRRMTIMNA